MNNALIGATGFVGTTLLRQTKFNEHYRSTNISDIRQRSFDTVVCAGAPAKKWIANKNPEADLDALRGLMSHLKTLDTKKMILISTVDVFSNPIEVDEDSPIKPDSLQPYGLHRYFLEEFVQENFEDHLIVRLPGLVGPGLRKNVIFDFLNNNNLHAIESRAKYQFYPMVNLWTDIQRALSMKVNLIHLTAEPVSVQDLAEQCFGFQFEQKLDGAVPYYDMRTKYSRDFEGSKFYQYSSKETFQAIRSYRQSERKTLGQDVT